MRILLDTHILLWAAANSSSLPATARNMIDTPSSQLFFSAASIWEVSIKNSLGKPDFQVDPSLLYAALMGAGYQELPILNAHTIGVGALPHHHSDPFDRLLVAQAIAEGMLLVTHDSAIAQYPGPIRKL
ncbi:type II toxin-antitoxin system VapC family toxin [Pseudomonas citronellolis]|uniref:Type II toxin-antitoxin system VapC family toxin n=1 Tax=Pseudomonas citronellolis TaxID=53408 RepID=A0AAW6NXZ1_9PSED|nr:type II toxin-antitoxin system VapC family toxin [Pseudomonas citronellolis]MDF3840090.1 type II toxin-antitoxin system VapC family toxin [Pseudomonas citronellolis]